MTLAYEKMHQPTEQARSRRF